MASPDQPTQQHQLIINSKLDFYNRTFDNIQFIHLNGSNEKYTRLQTLINKLGNDPVALDYQHPAELRKDVMFVTTERLKLMLENNVISATLFQVGKDSIYTRPTVCVVTLNPMAIVADEIQTLRYMLDYEEQIIRKIHAARRLDTDMQLRFLLDHEFFHCIDSYLYGGAPVTHQQMGGEYHQYRRESIADAYALSLHLMENGELTTFARNIVHLRALSMFNSSPSHHTFETLSEIVSNNIDELSKMDLMDAVTFSKKMRDRIVGSYQHYIQHQAAELAAAKRLGLRPVLNELAYKELEKISVDQINIDRLIKHYKYFYRHLFTDTIIDLGEAQIH